MQALSYEPSGLEAIDHNGPHLLFAEHHRSLHRAGEDLIARALEDDCFSLVVGYRAFEKQILEHMAAEEELVLPAYAEACPTEAAAIREAHEVLRRQMERTALDVELHAVRIGALRDLLATLERHAEAEDKTLYPWAQVHMPAANQGALGTRLVASMRQLARLVL